LVVKVHFKGIINYPLPNNTVARSAKSQIPKAASRPTKNRAHRTGVKSKGFNLKNAIKSLSFKAPYPKVQRASILKYRQSSITHHFRFVQIRFSAFSVISFTFPRYIPDFRLKINDCIEKAIQNKKITLRVYHKSQIGLEP